VEKLIQLVTLIIYNIARPIRTRSGGARHDHRSASAPATAAKASPAVGAEVPAIRVTFIDFPLTSFRHPA